ncbi:MAG: DUF2141 domain-containing protein [Bacteroidales bacterium]|nr:DUF2141 domain-containing protein [Bacteroidales bacterium]
MYRFLLCFLFLSNVVCSQNPQLVIKIQNIEVREGNIRIGVFNTSEKFLKQGSTYKNYLISVKNTTESIIIDDLEKGEYAIMLYHDKNSDGKLNQNIIGIPKEPFGFSNNIKPKLSKPTFEECKFSLNSNRLIHIKLDHY